MAKEKNVIEELSDEQFDINPLKKETVSVRHIPKQSGMFSDKRHLFYGGLADTAQKVIVPPMNESGFLPVLTSDEAKFLEKVMGMDEGALSPHKKTDNYWSSTNPAVNVILGKEDVYLDLSNPVDFIKYKVLLANKVKICPSVKELQNNPKATYEFVLVKEHEEIDDAKSKMNILMQCYKQYGKIEEDKYRLRKIVELITSKPLDINTKLSFLQVKCNELIQANPKTFLSTISDPLLDAKIIISKCVENKVISKRGDQYYLTSDNTPLCGPGEDPTLNVAARYINQANHQDLKLLLESKIQDN